MQKTQNLQLNIIAGTDVPSHAVFNENFNKLDEFARTMNDYDKNQNLRITHVEKEVETLKAHDETNTENITDLIDKVEVLTKAVSEIEVIEGSTTKKGKLHIVKFLVEPSTMTNNNYLFQEFGVDSETETRISAGVYNVRSQINATEIFGINDVSKIDILSCTSLAKGYYNYTGETNPIPMNVRTIATLPSVMGGNSDIILELYGNSTSMSKQTYHDNMSGGWQPSGGGAVYPQKGKVTIILQAVIYE